ncbi:hypothetical protein DY218_05945 [Streptomyces triticagri]|uniref:DUF4097 domain-containing protein n=1 Tax=Streptomyces triticagri TaxID=2293568 RepID=A0A372MA28_9ACTN|nr:DUF4097 family beta strand repeat-containing protein [Streptomyces triticagri]RFU87792.1 hypothetical protein DY218_05945 [Streptomyces triticagri]
MRTSRRTLFAVSGALLAGVTLAGCGAGDGEEERAERSFALPQDRLTVDVDNGSVDIRTADVDRVEVTRWFTGRSIGGSAKADWTMKDGALTLRSKCGGISLSCEARYEIRVPRGSAVKLDTRNGAVEAAGFTEALDLRSANGAVTVRESSGPVKLRTNNGSLTTEQITSSRVTADSANGSVRLAFAEAPDEARASTHNGEIDLVVPRGTSYAVSTETKNGKASVDVPEDESSRHRLSAKSHNRDITVRAE